jgi:RNA polymerase sigma-70 factor (ECF subfamily)
MADPNADRFLAARMVRGDEAAFSEFFDATFPALFRFALTRVEGNEDAAEEVVQATLCRAMRKIAGWRGEASLFTWLCTICRHEISHWYQQRKKAGLTVDLTDDTLEIRAALESLGAAAGDAGDRRETSRIVQLVLDRLPTRYGDALEWKYIEGLSVVEIATRLGVAPKAAESILTRARVAFRDAFTAVYGHWSEAGS